MLTALLLPLSLLATPAGDAVRAGQTAGGDDPAIQIWISNDRYLLQGEQAKVQIRTREDGYLIVLHVDPDGHLRVLFPVDPKDDNFARGGRKYEIHGRGGREAFTADDGKGRGTVYAAVSHEPLRFDPFVLGDHWDYHQLAPQRLSAEPEQELNELVRRMADGSFDYDILTYDVVERVVYASDYNDGYGSYYGYGSSYGCGYSYYGCGHSYYGSPFSLSVGLFFGYPYYRRSYYDPFYASYNPFYDPFFYAPYYYRPYYYRPVYGYPGYAYPYYNYPYYNYPYGYGVRATARLRRVLPQSLSALYALPVPAGRRHRRRVRGPPVQPGSLREHGVPAAHGARAGANQREPDPACDRRSADRGGASGRRAPHHDHVGRRHDGPPRARATARSRRQPADPTEHRSATGTGARGAAERRARES